MTESSHKLTGVKTILSVRAQRQHLFVLEKMILTLINILFSARSTPTPPPTVRCSVSSSSKQLYNKNRRCLALFNYYLCWRFSGRMEINMKIINEIRKYIKENMDWLDDSKINLENSLNEIGIDSLSLMMILVFLENKYNVDTNIVLIGDNEVNTLNDILELLGLTDSDE